MKRSIASHDRSIIMALIKRRDMHMNSKRAEILKELRTIPGVGEKIAEDLLGLGAASVTWLKGKDPERLYRTLCLRSGGPVDRCMLYVLRCAVYFASARKHDPALLKWWNWKD
jgi:hypothetical protein